jgi:Fur family transcriptional regulator, ferric uptake regulator
MLADVGEIGPDELLARLREGGGRVTLQRRVIVETLLAQPDHVTAEELIAKVQARYPEVNAATVYRTLDALDEIGALKRLAVGKGPTQWELTTSAHQHLVCDLCGEVQEVSGGAFARLAASLVKQHGFYADIGHLAVTGRCAACAAGDRIALTPHLHKGLEEHSSH